MPSGSNTLLMGTQLGGGGGHSKHFNVFEENASNKENSPGTPTTL